MIGAQLFALMSGSSPVAALAGDRMYPLVRPQSGALPAIVYTVVDDVPTDSLEGWTSGVSNARVQIDCYAKTYVSAQALADAVSGALASSGSGTLSASLLTRRDGYEDETGLYRVSLDVSTWVDWS